MPRRARRTGTRPWWIPPPLGPVPELEPRLLRLLGLVSVALFFEAYDLSMLTSALYYIARDLHFPETSFPHYLATIRLGALPALLIVPLSDRIGRRQVFIASVAGVGVGTCATAFTQTPAQFVAAQMATRTFFVICTGVSAVILAEEFPAEHRGWGIGMLGALSNCGFGLGAALFAAIDVLPWGWRALYLVGLLPLLLLPRLRRDVPETERFVRAGADVTGSWMRPFVDLVRTYPGRTAALTLAATLFAIGETSVFQFTGWYTKAFHGWTPGRYSTMVLVGGAVGVLGNVAAGRLGDVIGRRVVGAALLVAFPVFAGLFYRGPAWALPLAWSAFIFCETGANAILRAFSTELFPTRLRGTSAGWIALVQTLGWAGGLFLVGFLTHALADIPRMTTVVALIAVPAGAALLALPETTRRELEAISADVTPPRAPSRARRG